MKRNLSISAAILGVMWLAATGVLLFFVAGLAGVPALLYAFVAMDTAFIVLLALFITTNTRPRWPDPYGDATDQLLRPPLYIGEDRRVRDGTIKDRSLTERISDMVEAEAGQRPMSSSTPSWIASIRHDDAGETFKEGDE